MKEFAELKGRTEWLRKRVVSDKQHIEVLNNVIENGDIQSERTITELKGEIEELAASNEFYKKSADHNFEAAKGLFQENQGLHKKLRELEAKLNKQVNKESNKENKPAATDLVNRKRKRECTKNTSTSPDRNKIRKINSNTRLFIGKNKTKLVKSKSAPDLTNEKEFISLNS